jgi:hypothetical protein
MECDWTGCATDSGERPVGAGNGASDVGEVLWWLRFRSATREGRQEEIGGSRLYPTGQKRTFQSASSVIVDKQTDPP